MLVTTTNAITHAGCHPSQSAPVIINATLTDDSSVDITISRTDHARRRMSCQSASSFTV